MLYFLVSQELESHFAQMSCWELQLIVTQRVKTTYPMRAEVSEIIFSYKDHNDKGVKQRMICGFWLHEML